MKILKMGHPNEVRTTCKECECEFLYNNNDIQKEYKQGLYDSYEKKAWINCPCCNHKIILRNL